MAFNRRIARNIKRKAGFAHARSCGKENQIGSIQTGNDIVQCFDAGRNRAKLIFIGRIEQIQTIKGLHEDFADFLKSLHIFALPDIKNALLRRIQQSI